MRVAQIHRPRVVLLALRICCWKLISGNDQGDSQNMEIRDIFVHIVITSFSRPEVEKTFVIRMEK